jgi:hypothetical protein
VTHLPLNVTSTDGLKSFTRISSSSSCAEVDAPGLDISGLTSGSSISTSSGDTDRSATDTERVRDRERALGATRFRLVGVFDGSIAGGGVGARSENAFSYMLELMNIPGQLGLPLEGRPRF